MSAMQNPLTRLAGAVLLGFLASCPSFTSTLYLQNETNETLVPYPVVTSPPPPHREADPANEIAPGGRLEIDTQGFNPLFYAPVILDQSVPNGVFVGMGLYEDDPPILHIRLFHHLVPPGQEGTDPTKQPILLREAFEEVNDENLVIRVIQMPQPGELPIQIKIEPDTGS